MQHEELVGLDDVFGPVKQHDRRKRQQSGPVPSRIEALVKTGGWISGDVLYAWGRDCHAILPILLS
jgi:hypothetical protein